MVPNKLSVSSNIVHKPLSVNCLTPTKECRRSLRPTLAPYILLSLTNQVNPFSRSVPTQKKTRGAKTVRSKCLTLWGHLTPSTSQNMPCGCHLNRKIKDNPSFSASLESTSSTR